MNIQFNWLNDELATSGQIMPEDIYKLKELGFKSIICNRPDFESGPSQPTQDLISKIATEFDIEFSYLPVESSFQTEVDAKHMSELIKMMPKPILAYCRSGGRCMSLIGLSNQLGLISLK